MNLASFMYLFPFYSSKNIYKLKKNLKIIILFFTIIFVSCEKKDVFVTETTVNDDINFFIWRGLATYYLWKDEVSDLADDRFSSYNDLYSYFRNYNSPENVFGSLLYNYGTVDRFSWIVDDYVALENSFAGINVTNGMEFGLVLYENGSSNVYCYVRYVVPNSDAENKGVTRGMLFNKVDGVQITVNNYESLLFDDNTSYSIELADYNDGNPVSNSTTINLIKTEIDENPVKISKVFSEGNTKIGYLMYNQFARNYDSNLNEVFANFKSESVDELIVDLRYNPGGSTSSAGYLASMITGQFSGQLFSKEVWNDKIMNAFPSETFENNFTNEILNKDTNDNVILQENINNLELNKVYFIVSASSASASELVINSLSPYIDVRLVGFKTVGKQVGSITLYDSDNLFRSGENLNPNHKYAMQPICLEIKNKDNQNYPDGIIPATTLPGIELKEDFSNLGVLGEKSDPLLERTIQYILTGSKTTDKPKNSINATEIYNSKLANPASNNMFTDLKFRVAN